MRAGIEILGKGRQKVEDGLVERIGLFQEELVASAFNDYEFGVGNSFRQSL